MQKDAAAAKRARANAILYTSGRAVLLLAAILAVADLIYFYLTSNSTLVFGMMIPRMGALLASTATQASAVAVCNAIAYILIMAAILCALLAGRRYAFGVVAAVLFSADTLVAVWLTLASHSAGYLPSLAIHIVFEALIIAATVAGRRLCAAHSGVRSSLKLALFGNRA